MRLAERRAAGPIEPHDARHAVRGRYPAPLWDAGERGMVLCSWPFLGAVALSMDTLARAIGAAMRGDT